MAATFNNNSGLKADRDINQVAGNMTVQARDSDPRPSPWSDTGNGAAVETSTRVFITYRRDDTAGDAGRLYDSLTRRFGDGSVFMDAEGIQPGQEFGQVIRETIEKSDVVLVLIGRRWANATDASGRRRLANPDDWVRREIEAALDLDVALVPILVHGAPMPAREELPPSIQPLAGFHAFKIGDYWQGDIDRLADAIRRLG